MLAAFSSAISELLSRSTNFSGPGPRRSAEYHLGEFVDDLFIVGITVEW